MIADMEADFEELPLSPIAQKTMQNVRDGLQENRDYLESESNRGQIARNFRPVQFGGYF